jgi:hypothetical protein
VWACWPIGAAAGAQALVRPGRPQEALQKVKQGSNLADPFGTDLAYSYAMFGLNPFRDFSAADLRLNRGDV